MFVRKVLVFSNYCKIKLPAKMYIMNYPGQECLMRLILVVFHSYKDIQTVKLFTANVYCISHFLTPVKTFERVKIHAWRVL